MTKTKRRKNWHYRVITFLAASSQILYIRSVPVRAFRGKYKVMQDFKNIIEDLGLSKENILSAYAHNRILHLRKNLGIMPEFEYLEGDGIAEYKKFRAALNKRFKLVSFRII